MLPIRAVQAIGGVRSTSDVFHHDRPGIRSFLWLGRHAVRHGGVRGEVAPQCTPPCRGRNGPREPSRDGVWNPLGSPMGRFKRREGGVCNPSRNRTRAPSGEYQISQEVCMSACTVWALIWAAAAIVATVFAYRYKNLANRMKTRARIYIKYVPTDQLTGQERVVFEDLKKDLGLT